MGGNRMIDRIIMHEIVEKLRTAIPYCLRICDVSGRIVVSTDRAGIGEMNLLAIEALNNNAMTTASQASDYQAVGAAIPLWLSGSRIGAVVVEKGEEPNLFSAVQDIELLGRTITLLYEEMLLVRSRRNQTQEREQFLYEWLHFPGAYPEMFQKQGQSLGVDIAGPYTVVLLERCPHKSPFTMPMIEKLLQEKDILLPISKSQDLLILREDDQFQRKYRRIMAAWEGCHMGVCSGQSHLYTGYRMVQDSLELGKRLFETEYVHTYEKMKLAIALARTDVPGLENAYALLVEKGKNAQLAETLVAYIQLQGDGVRICERLHIHRNSIPYRIRRIQEICGKNLTDPYDLLYLYASMIRYTGMDLNPW